MTVDKEKGSTEPSAKPVKSSWLTHSLFWVCVCGVGFMGAWLAQRALYFDGIPPVPLRANPRILSISIFAIPGVLIITWWISRSTVRHSLLFPAAVLLVCLCLVGVISSLSPGPGSLATREIVQVSSVAPRKNTFAYPIYFDNDRFILTRSEHRRIIDALSVFRSCESSTLRVRGFASSAEFRPDRERSDEYNKNLANRRASAVRDLIKVAAGIEAVATVWATYDEMVGQRRLRDVGLDGERLLPIEKLNRRVEVFWNDSRCSEGERFEEVPLKP